MRTATISGPDALLDDLETRILGVRVHTISQALTVGWIDAWLASGARAHVVTINPEIVMRARRDSGYGELLERTRLNVPDGAGIVAAARLRRLPMRQRVTGVDLVDALAGLGSVHG